MTFDAPELAPFHRLAMTGYFAEIVAELMGDRSHVSPPDDTVFPKVMEVIWTGASHREVADDTCAEAVLIERHKEWAEARAISHLLFRYPALVVRLRDGANEQRSERRGNQSQRRRHRVPTRQRPERSASRRSHRAY